MPLSQNDATAAGCIKTLFSEFLQCVAQIQARAVRECIENHCDVKGMQGKIAEGRSKAAAVKGSIPKASQVAKHQRLQTQKETKEKIRSDALKSSEQIDVDAFAEDVGTASDRAKRKARSER